VTRVSILVDTNHSYSDTMITVLRHSPEYEFGKKIRYIQYGQLIFFQ
jgi:hypothetical protein